MISQSNNLMNAHTHKLNKFVNSNTLNKGFVLVF